MDVFYSLVDSSESLKEKAKLVRDNGLLWSSVADAAVLGAVFAAFYLPCGLLMRDSGLIYAGLVSAAVAVVSKFGLHPTVERTHIRLSDDQLNFIETQMKDKAAEKVNLL